MAMVGEGFMRARAVDRTDIGEPVCSLGWFVLGCAEEWIKKI
jgi:hypothetical protein